MKKITTIVGPVIAIGVITSLPLVASAHEHQIFKIGNKYYDFTVGSLNEPVAIDDKTGVDLRVNQIPGSAMTNHTEGMDHDALSTPAIGLEGTLKVELIAGDKKKVMSLTPAYNDPGAYRAPFYPTVQTTYSYRFFGTLNDIPVDLTFTCNPAGHPAAPEDTNEVEMGNGVTRISKRGAFGCPVAKADLGFPEPSPSLVELGGESNSSSIALVLSIVGVVGAGLALLKAKKA